MPTYRHRSEDGSEYCGNCRMSVPTGARRCPHCTSRLWPPGAQPTDLLGKAILYVLGPTFTVVFLATVGAGWRGEAHPVAIAATGSVTALFWVAVLRDRVTEEPLASLVDSLVASHLSRYYRRWWIPGFVGGCVVYFLLFTGAIAPTRLLAPFVAEALAPLGLGGPGGAAAVFQATAAGGYLLLLYGYYRATVHVRTGEPREADPTGTTTGLSGGRRVDDDLDGEWKHDTAEAERAHRRAQQRDPPVELGQRVAFPVVEVDDRERQLQGAVERFRIFVDQDVPPDVEKGQMVCVQIMHWATDESGNRVGAHARFVEYGRC